MVEYDTINDEKEEEGWGSVGSTMMMVFVIQHDEKSGWRGRRRSVQPRTHIGLS